MTTQALLLSPPLPCGPIALAIAAALMAGCAHDGPMFREKARKTCPDGLVAMAPTATYAVYWGANSDVKALEWIKGIPDIKDRCVAEVTSPPPGPAPTPVGSPAPCPSGQTSWPRDALYAEYFQGFQDGNDKLVQLEDLRALMQRCIVEIPPTGAQACPPPPSTHIVMKNGVQYCVPY